MDEANEQMASPLDETPTRRDTFCYARNASCDSTGGQFDGCELSDSQICLRIGAEREMRNNLNDSPPR